MLEHLRGLFSALLTPIARFLLRIGVSPDAVTLFGAVGVVASAVILIPQGHLWQGVLVITAFCLTDLVDGLMARLSGRTTKFGAFLDSTLDRIADGTIFGGALLWLVTIDAPQRVLVLAMLCLVMGSVTPYARARAESVGYQAKVGIAERADRLVIIGASVLLTDLLDDLVYVEVALWFLALASTVTVLQRIWTVRQQALAEAAAS